MLEMKHVSLKKFISVHFFKAALLPLLVIEVALVALYFSINIYNDLQTRKTMETISRSHLQEIAADQAEKIGEQLAVISTLSKVLQKQANLFFNTPDSFAKPAQAPTFGVAPNGVYYKLNDNGGASLFYSAITPIGPAEKAKAEKTEALDVIFRHVFESNKNIVAVYFNAFDSMCRYYPFMKDVYGQFPRDMDIPKYNFYYLADEAHNKLRQPVWTEAYLDPAGKGWMMSCIVPVYRKDTLEGVIGIDITIDQFINNILSLKLPWDSKAFLVDVRGTIMALPPEVEKVLDLAELHKNVYAGQVHQDTFKPEEFNLLASSIPGLSAIVDDLLKQQKGVGGFSVKGVPYLLTQATVGETNWKLFVISDKQKILQPVQALQYNTQLIGFSAIGVMILFYLLFFIYLFRNTSKMASELARPVADIAEASSRLTQGDYETRLAKSNVEELDILVSSFEGMASQLERFHANLEDQVRSRTKQLEDTQQQLVQSEKMASIGQLAAGVAHEINNPMGVVIGNLSSLDEYHKALSELVRKYDRLGGLMLQAGIEGEVGDLLRDIEKFKNSVDMGYLVDDLPKLMAQMEQSAARVKKIVRDLMVFSRPEDQSWEDVSINDMIDRIIDMICVEMKDRVQVVREYQHDLPRYRCSRQQISQMFINLLINATQSIVEKGTVTVRTSLSKDDIVIEITDTGAGIPDEVKSKIFDPFFTTKPVGKGTGLGLSVVYNIIQRHNGAISFSSTVGVGTTFTVLLPRQTT